ncbi:MAG: hypothetical protein AAF958_19680 [Planctomycetota bacterium]
MNSETIREWLGRQPFEPFILALSNGETHTVKHPENVIVLKSRLILGFPETDSVVHVGLIHVNSIEPLQTV